MKKMLLTHSSTAKQEEKEKERGSCQTLGASRMKMKMLKKYKILILSLLLLSSCGYWIKQYKPINQSEPIIINNWELKPIISLISTQNIPKETLDLKTDFVVYFKIYHHNNDGSILKFLPNPKMYESPILRDQILIDSLFIEFNNNLARLKNKKKTNFAQSTLSSIDFLKIMGYNYAPDDNETVTNLGIINIPNDADFIKFSFRVQIFNIENGEIFESFHFQEIFKLDFYKKNQKVDELILDMMNV